MLRASGEANPDPGAVEEAVVEVMECNLIKDLVKEHRMGVKWKMEALMEPQPRILGIDGPKMIQ